MVVKDVYCTPHSHLISPSILSIHCRRQHTTASVIHHNYSTLRFTLSAVVLHEETVGDPVEVYSDYEKSSNRGFALCCVVVRSPTLHPRKYVLRAFQIMLSLPLQIGH